MPEMQSSKLAGSKPSVAAQRHLDIAEIKEDVVIMKDGTLRAVLLVESINFALKSEDEQQAIVQAYVQFLNAIDFPLQIVVQSRRLNIEPYLIQLKELEQSQTNELLRQQMVDYQSFLVELIRIGEIMQKRFFVVVPYNPLSDKAKGFWKRLGEVFSPVLSVRLAEDRFRKQKEALTVRIEHVLGNLQNMGLRNTQQLDTQGLIELYYGVYNPETFDVQKLEDTSKIRVE